MMLRWPASQQQHSYCKHTTPIMAWSTVIITVSDRSAAGERADLSGPEAAALLDEELFDIPLRVTAGLSWLVVVAAEMIAGRDGLGFAVMDSRNGLRTDLLVVEMIVIGLIGVVLDRLLVQLTKIESVRWGYER